MLASSEVGKKLVANPSMNRRISYSYISMYSSETTLLLERYFVV